MHEPVRGRAVPLSRCCAVRGQAAPEAPPLSQSRKSKKKSKDKDREREKKSKKKRGEETVLRVAAPARGRPQGRYTKREAGKLVKGYSQEDLSMILGVVPADFVAPAAVGAAAPSASEEPEAEAKARKKRRRDRSPAAAEAPKPAVATEQEEEEEQEAWTPPAPDWWGASMFRWAGRLGGIRRATTHEKGFCEDDQVAAYNAVHDGATHGKQGLGVRDAPKKVAGARWAGSKVRFGEDAAEDDAPPEPATGADAAMRKIKWKVRAGAPNSDPCQSTDACPQKLAEAALRALPGGAATLSALRRSVLSAAGVGDAKDAREAAATALSRCALMRVRALMGGADA